MDDLDARIDARARAVIESWYQMYMLPQLADLKQDIASMRQLVEGMATTLNRASGGATVGGKIADLVIGAIGALITLAISHYWR